MNRYTIHQKSFAACEEMRCNAAAAVCRSVDIGETVICPKPRRLGLLQPTLHEPSYPKPLRCYHQELFYSKAGSELLDIILTKQGGCEEDPFFRGSPPSRVSNPLIEDARFGDEPCGAIPKGMGMGKGGCVGPNFGNSPSVRVEGFDCSIPALA